MALEVKNFDTASQFVAALRPDVSRPRQLGALVYRGQEDATWGLIPSAFRKDTKFPTKDGWWTIDEHVRRWISAPGMHRDRSRWAASLERETLRVFFDASDDAGLPLPEDSQAIRATLERGHEAWPEVALLSILALAQHHGVPTRLLDWSWDWRVAAFFAACGSLRMNCDAPLAVWSLDVEQLRYQEVPGLREPPKKPRQFRLRLVTAPTASNSNLRAQKGLFTLLEVVDSASMEPWTPLDRLADDNELGGHALELVKYTLPSSEAPTLMHQLHLECMTAAILFPGYGGVVQSLKDRALWNRRPYGLAASVAGGS
jgi:hypothetical protein